MDSKNNVIDLKSRRPAKAKGKTEKKGPAAPVVDMTQRREEVLKQERRLVKRTILTEFIGVFIVIPRMGLQKVTLYDISENGLSFDCGADLGKFKMGEEVAMRVYLSQKNYLPFVVKVANMRTIENEGVTRHGANFVKGTLNDQALYHFVKFIETVSMGIQSDKGDLLVPAARR